MTKQNGKIQRSKNRTAGSPSSTESCQMEDESRPIPDLSILRKSITTSITGFTQARDVFDTGTEELKEMLATECDVIYECRVCRNLFRSLANFISHKRVYCRQKFNTSLHAHFINNKFLKDDMMMILQNEQDYQNFLNNKNTSENEKQYKISSETKKSMAKDLTSIVERLATRNQNTSNLENQTSSKPLPERLIKFQSITSSPTAVYQNLCSSKKDLRDLIKDQVTELDNMISSREAILGPDGKLLLDTVSSTPKINDAVIQISDEDEENTGHEIVCKICKIKFATLKTLRFHMKHKHAPNRLVFPCPDCSDTFANAWGVYRHLFKVHRKSAAHIRKLRDSIQNKAYRLQKPPPSEKKSETPEETESISEQHRMDLENQAWMDNLETDGEVPRCGGCGRRFERRAALSSHRQTCQLRIAAQNKISSNLQRRVVTKTAPKEPPEPPQTPRTPALEPRIKIPKIDIKPIEKTIEIQIRRDYNKGSTASPVSMGTSSPVSEPAADGDVAMLQHCSESAVKERELASGSTNTNRRSKGFLGSKGANYSPQKLPRSPTISLPESGPSRKGGHEAEPTAHNSARPSSIHRSNQLPHRNHGAQTQHLQDPPGHPSSDFSSQRFHRGDSSSEDSGGEGCATPPHTFDDIRQIIFGQVSSQNWNLYTVNAENRDVAKEFPLKEGCETGGTEPPPETIQK